MRRLLLSAAPSTLPLVALLSAQAPSPAPVKLAIAGLVQDTWPGS